jgi:hypothetical protein
MKDIGPQEDELVQDARDEIMKSTPADPEADDFNPDDV